MRRVLRVAVGLGAAALVLAIVATALSVRVADGGTLVLVCPATGQERCIDEACVVGSVERVARRALRDGQRWLDERETAHDWR